jgi:hypothetical protein
VIDHAVNEHFAVDDDFDRNLDDLFYFDDLLDLDDPVNENLAVDKDLNRLLDHTLNDDFHRLRGSFHGSIDHGGGSALEFLDARTQRLERCGITGACGL